MKKRVVILTKSSKFGAYCVAGIDFDTKKWIRLVSEDKESHGALNAADLICDKVNLVQVLDVVDVEIKGYENNSSQPENAVIDRSVQMKYVDRMTIEGALALYQDSEPEYILGDSSYRIREELVPTLGRSLSFVVVSDLCFTKHVNDAGNNKIKLSFMYNGIDYSNMSVTDIGYYGVNNGTTIKRAAIVVSVGTPYNGNCYKFVAAIYPLEQ